MSETLPPSSIPSKPKLPGGGAAGDPDQEFLSHLANERNVAASTLNQALSAVLFLNKEVLKLELPWLGTFGRVQRPANFRWSSPAMRHMR